MENENKAENLPDCCKKTDVPEDKKGIWQAIAYGLLPHTGCIAFIIVTVIGATTAMTLLRPLMLNAYFFYVLIAISFIFAAIASVVYLKKHGLLSTVGAKKKWKYLTTMFGITILTNLLLFMVIFPVLANVGGVTGAAALDLESESSITLKVNIPCPGHAPLVSNDIKALGVSAVNFKFPNIFEIGYDPGKVSKSQILGLEIFKTYSATVIDESFATAVQQEPANSGGGCGCGGGGSSSCGGNV